MCVCARACMCVIFNFMLEHYCNFVYLSIPQLIRIVDVD